jgi:L-2-hydroxyglutarate oxidase LhgO
MDRIDCVVIGAGVVGLSIARSLAMAGREVVILEAENAIGTQTSARNSEVIHAGISYAPGSLKGRLCVAGKAALYGYCEERGIGHQRIGKLIVAVQDSELPELDKYVKLGAAHGVNDLRIIGAAEARDMEPEVACVGALHSPSTGIVDSHALMLSYLGDAERAGASLALQSRVLAAKPTPQGIVLEVGGAEKMNVLCGTVVNAAGLGAQQVASRVEGMPAALVRPLY